jgi:integrase
MRVTIETPYLFVKRDIYYFSRRVPSDLVQHYRCARISMSLKTRSLRAAKARAASLACKLDQDWLSLRWQSTDETFSRFLSDSESAAIAASSAPTLSEAGRMYVDAKQQGRPETFHQAVDRALSRMIALAGDKPIDTYSRDEANGLRDDMRHKGLANSSIKRSFNVIRAVVNFVSREKGLDEIRTFSSIYFGEDVEAGSTKRATFSPEDLSNIQSQCRELDDEPRWLIALISDTGMRLSEAAGLIKEDINLDDDHPHLNLKPHPWRPLKTRGSARIVPLVGMSLWAVQRAIEASSSNHLFPKYCDEQRCKSNSASAALNKWMSPRVQKGTVVHSLRHALKDRLRAVECPKDIQERLGGWTVEGVGETYGEGYPVSVLHRWMDKIV